MKIWWTWVGKIYQSLPALTKGGSLPLIRCRHSSMLDGNQPLQRKILMINKMHIHSSYSILAVAAIFASGQAAQAQMMIPSTNPSVATLNDYYRSPMVSGLPQIVPVSPIATPAEAETNEQIGFESMTSINPFAWKAGVTASWSYNTNILCQSNAIADQSFTQGCFVQAAYGAEDAPLNFTGQYAIGYNELLDHSEYNSLNNNLTLAANWNATDKLKFISGLSFVQGRGSTMGAGAQNQNSSLAYSLSGRYQIDEKLSTGCSATFETLTQQTGPDYYNANGTVFLDYAIDPKLTMGLSAGSGERFFSGSEIDTNIGGHGTYTPTEKFSINGDVSLGIRNFSTGGTELYPNVLLGCNYQPTDGTQFNLSFYNTLDAGYFTNALQPNTELGFTLGLSQRIVQKIFLNVYGGYQTNSFSSQISNSGASNGGNAVFGGSVAWNMFRHVDLSVFTTWLVDRQTGGSSYTQGNTGVQVAVSF